MATTVDVGSSSDRRFYHPGQRDWATLLETAAESGGGRTLLEIELAPGGGNPPHVHLTYDETFTVVSGELTIRHGRDTLVLREGESATAARGTVHCFSNPGDSTCVFRVALEPGHRGFEQAIQIGYSVMESGRKRLRPYELAVLLEMAEMQFVGPMRLLTPVFRLLARRGRRLGVDARLIEQYVRV
jgi:quercetin dioxygenase-like cupin family protein